MSAREFDKNMRRGVKIVDSVRNLIAQFGRCWNETIWLMVDLRAQNLCTFRLVAHSQVCNETCNLCKKSRGVIIARPCELF